ncbi:type VI immunity family protein [Mesorhizobium sp. LNJC405B00]|uniref:type VI immunity family protein n=1 Tax=unclassified Mesorhizobium TaxID=325217 RepID=UPI0003CF80B4|nr:type VI immunity family protein [Mesorhizobium sp. LNJC405B00]ESY00350.1 hypothetical protein X755_09145 [Mesorhizobium sp. LNJC405B00]
MNLDQLNHVVTMRSGDYLAVRPGLSICLFYAEPASEISADVARILEAYMDFIKPNYLNSYLATDGAWKSAKSKVFSSTLENLRRVKKGNFAEFHFGQEPNSNVGEFGAHYKAGPLNDPFFDRSTNVLHLEFPLYYAEEPQAARLASFVEQLIRFRMPDSGYCGYAFKHLFMTFTDQAFAFIASKAMRFVGFDVPEDAVRLWARGHVYNVSWITLLGPNIMRKLGGSDGLRRALAASLKVTEINGGLLIQSSEKPVAGDVNRGMKDIEPMVQLATVTKPARIEVANVGPSIPDFAERWLSRFDSLNN